MGLELRALVELLVLLALVVEPLAPV